MKILFIDPVCWPEHCTYNGYWIEVFRKGRLDFKAVLQSGYATRLGLGPDDLLWEYPAEMKVGFGYKLKLLYRIFQKADLSQFDYVVFSVVNKQAFLLSPFFFFTKAVIVSHVWKRFSVMYKMFLCLLARRHYLVSIDPFIHRNLLQNGIPNILIVHPSPGWKADGASLKEHDYFEAYVPGRNSNHDFIDMVLKDGTLENWLAGNAIRLIVRCSGKASDSNDFLVFSDQFLVNEVYRKKMEEADVIIIPYDCSFTNRISNIFFESVALKKNILIKRHTHLDNYRMFDPQGVHIRYFETMDEFKRHLLYFKTAPEVSGHFFEKLESLFSIENMGSQFCKLINQSE